MCERFKRGDFALCSLGLELLVQMGDVTADRISCEFSFGKLGKLRQIGLVCLSGFGTECFLFCAIAEVCSNVFV